MFCCVCRTPPIAHCARLLQALVIFYFPSDFREVYGTAQFFVWAAYLGPVVFQALLERAAARLGVEQASEAFGSFFYISAAMLLAVGLALTPCCCCCDRTTGAMRTAKVPTDAR